MNGKVLATHTNKIWHKWKSRTINAFKLSETFGIATAQGGYHGASNVVNVDDTQILDESSVQFQLRNNASIQEYQNNLSAVTDEIRELYMAMMATQ